jgi:hypothetical protein
MQIKVGALALLASVAAAGLLFGETVLTGTRIGVTLHSSVSSKTARVGQHVEGSVAEAVVVGGKTLIPRGAPATLVVASAQPSGRLQTPARLYLRIGSIKIGGKSYAVDSRWAGEAGTSHKKRNITAAGGGAAAGAIIGAIAGGGKGAAIGAAAGAGAGTAGAAATGKKDIEFPVETRLRFMTKAPIVLK